MFYTFTCWLVLPVSFLPDIPVRLLAELQLQQSLATTTLFVTWRSCGIESVSNMNGLNHFCSKQMFRY